METSWANSSILAVAEANQRQGHQSTVFSGPGCSDSPVVYELNGRRGMASVKKTCGPVASTPGHDEAGQKKDGSHKWIAADDEQVSDNASQHDARDEDRTYSCIRRDQHGKSPNSFQYAGYKPKPLADSNLVEDLDHLR